MTIEELNRIEEQLQEGLLKISSGLGLLDGTLLQSDDLEGKWKEWAPEYMALAVKEINEYPEFTLACAAYAGTAAAKWWDEDWGRHHGEPFASLLGKRGFDDMDDHISNDILGYAPDSTAAGVLRSAFECLSSQAWSFLNHSAVERGTKDAFYALSRAANVLFRLGAAIELKKLGYRYQAIDTSRFS